jgi:hypothetical protein
LREGKKEKKDVYGLVNMSLQHRKQLFIYLLLGRNMEPSMNTDPDSSIYQQVLSSP